MTDRRADVGQKIFAGCAVISITWICGLFLNNVMAKAEDGLDKAGENEIAIVKISSTMDAIKDDIKEIKDLLKEKLL